MHPAGIEHEEWKLEFMWLFNGALKKLEHTLLHHWYPKPFKHEHLSHDDDAVQCDSRQSSSNWKKVP